ncbi:MAG: serine/threonine-protein kinase [Myxococcota bacterium]|nr:serine/threonine-protein kinase [Myxococcota bacterium]
MSSQSALYGATPVKFGNYLLLDRVNVGGMAEIFRAKSFGLQGFEKILAIKRILPNMAEDDEFINMFVDEARIAVQLNHPNIVQIYELGMYREQYYIAMEYVSGRDLRQILDNFRGSERKLPLSVAAYIIIRICEGLDYAHSKEDGKGRPLNVIHRDVSPQNILVGYSGEVKITDFGIAKAEDRVSKTQAGVLKGKFSYMSPEQVRGHELDHRADIFSVGILLYEMITGERLFMGASDFAILEKVRNAEVSTPREYCPDMPEELEGVIMKALAGERDERYQTVGELGEAMEMFLIEERSIFNSKKLSQFMQLEYEQEMTAERERLESFQNYNMSPVAEKNDIAGGHVPEVDSMPDGDSEKTMIFESGFGFGKDADKTQIGSMDGLVGASKVPPTVDFGKEEAIQPEEEEALDSFEEQVEKGSLNWKPAALVMFTMVVCASALYWAFQTRQTSLEIVTEPTEEISIVLDGTRIGEESPVRLKAVLPGRHRLRIRAEGYKPYEQEFRIEEGQGFRIEAQLERLDEQKGLEKGSLLVVSEPESATVRLNGEVRGSAPVTVLALPVGEKILVEVSAPGYLTKLQAIQLKEAGELKTVRVVLEADEGVWGQILVKSEPSGARVFMNGVELGITPVESAKMKADKVIGLRLVSPGIGEYTTKVRVKGGKTTKVYHHFRPTQRQPGQGERGTTSGCQGTSGFLSVMTIGESGCEVKVGGRVIGDSPFFRKKVPTGKCSLHINCASGKTFRRHQQINAKKETRLIIRKSDWNP